MFVILHLPLADLRGLQEDRAGRLPKPDWSLDDPGQCFIRGFGKMSARNAQGYGLLGERGYIEFDNAVAFTGPPVIHQQHGWHRGIPLHVWFRRLYFDGDMAGRFEIGFLADDRAEHEIFTFNSENSYDVGHVGRTI